MVGGATPVSALITAGLLDEIRMTICPLVLGSGKPPLDVKEQRPLQFLNGRTLKSCVVNVSYAL